MSTDEEAIHVGGKFTLELSHRLRLGPVVLKYPTAAVPTPQVLARLEHEYEVGRALHLPGVRGIIGQSMWKNRPALELHYVPGQTFKAYFQVPERRHLERVLRLAVSAVKALESLHEAGIIHRDIAATNLLVTEDQSRAVIIDLGLATSVGHHDRHPVFSIEGQLPYLSPEQTGRLDLPVDARSDLYSFGVVLYEMLTGQLPFSAEDTNGWIHAHLARQPEPPSAKVPELPDVISALVLRLLAKVPDQRYQSARGLRHDLETCLSELRARGDISPFLLGRADHSAQLRPPSRLYGRDVELERLGGALKRAIAGEPGLVFITGFAGSGKTALANELCFPVVAAGGRFISGKFDQTLRAIPYAAFAGAFTQLCRQLLGGSPAELKAFGSRVLETLGTNAGLLLELVPELERVIGPQPSPPPLPTAESANRFALSLLGFFHCLVEVEHPLVLFLDDLQWADAASLDLLEMMVTRAARRHFLVIGAFRTSERADEELLGSLVMRLERSWGSIERLSLLGLDQDESEALVADVLDISNAEAAPLAALLHAKTDGNPFFLCQVLEALAREGTLRFDPKADTWKWEVARVHAQKISDNVIELMLRKIARLPTEARTALQVAACIGSTFALELVAAGSDAPGEPRAALAVAIEDGLIAVLNGSARFTHDRIQQVAYQTLAPVEAQRIHLRLGRRLLAERQGKERMLEAVQQLNLGSGLVEDEAERRELARLNYEAGLFAKSTMAYLSARAFFSEGERLLGSNAGSSPLSFELRRQQGEMDFCTGAVEQAVTRLRGLVPEAPSLVERAGLYQQLIAIHTVAFRLSEALAIGTEALAELGVFIPADRSAEAVAAGVRDVDATLAGREVATFVDMARMTDENELAVMGLLTHLSTAAYIANSNLFPFVVLELVRRAIKGGPSSVGAFGFVAYGMLLASDLERVSDARAFGELAVAITGRLHADALRARVTFFHAVFILHWSEPLERTLPLLDAGWKAGIDAGDLQFASYCINHIHGNGLFAGQSLVELEQSLRRFSEVNDLLHQEDGKVFFSLLVRCVGALRQPQEGLPELAVDHPDATLDTLRSSGNATVLSFYFVLKTLVALILDKPVEALAAAEQGAGALGGVASMTWVPEHAFLHGLVLGEGLRGGRVERQAGLEQLGRLKEQLARWAVHSVANYDAKARLLEAELVDLRGAENGAVLDAYDAAIDAATRGGRTLDEGLATERAARCWARRGKPHLAALYMQRSRQTYEVWGAEAKVAQLTRDHASLLAQVRAAGDAGTSSSTSSSSGGGLHAADVQSVLKAAQTVAGELVMDRMLSRLIRLVIETAGAQNGSLLLEQEGEWRVVAEQRSDREGAEVLEWRKLADCPEIASAVVLYVARTRESVNLDDAAKSTVFATDASIARRQCKSVLCLPIMNRGSLGGILYLENNLASHAFTRTHTRILQLLTMQAISSLEISRYYARVQTLNQSLENEIDERKRTESKLEFLANHDALTSLPNRRLFYDRVQHSIARAQRLHERVAVLFLDLDQFKTINDSLSHQVGDRLLKDVASRLSGLVRKGDTLARLGGDEYVLLIEGSPELHDLANVADKVLSAFRQPFYVDGHVLYPTGSLGISLYPDDAKDADELLRNADAAMYQAKEQGRNNFQFFSAELAVAAAERLALENDLRRAIEEREFELFFQPQFLLETGKVVGAEALIRWNHPRRGLLLPGSFISVAEENGSIIPIGEWVLHQACAQLARWQRDGVGIGSLAINVSGSQFGWQGGFAALVRRALKESGVEPARLEIELTESVIMQDTDYAKRALSELHKLGVRMAIDDFGTGYSSLSYLKRLPVGRLKIDRSFVANLPAASDDAMIVQSIMVLGRNLGKQVIAEGIETEAQRSFLREAGCLEGQGYLFGAPMPLKAFTEVLRRSS